MKKTRKRLSLAMLVASTGCGGSSPPDENATQAALIVGSWRQTDSTTGARKVDVTFTADGRLSVKTYNNGVTDKTFSGTYSVGLGALSVNIVDNEGRRMELSSYLALAGDAFAVGFDDNETVYMPKSESQSLAGSWVAFIVTRALNGAVVTSSSERTFELVIRDTGTWSRTRTRIDAQNGVVAPLRRETDEGVEWRELSPGRYSVKKMSTSTPVIYRQIGKALAAERSLFSRVP